MHTPTQPLEQKVVTAEAIRVQLETCLHECDVTIECPDLEADRLWLAECEQEE